MCRTRVHANTARSYDDGLGPCHDASAAHKDALHDPCRWQGSHLLHAHTVTSRVLSPRGLSCETLGLPSGQAHPYGSSQSREVLQGGLASSGGLGAQARYDAQARRDAQVQREELEQHGAK